MKTSSIEKPNMVASAASGDELPRHVLPRLEYDYADLQPCIDSRTMTLHHDLHHGGYVDKLNLALEDYPALRRYSALWLLLNLDQVPRKIRPAVHHNAGGHVNHSLFWRAMKPAGGGEPHGALASAIARDFGGLEKFQAAFDAAGSGVFGSGWVWLVRLPEEGDKLAIVTTSGHDHPLMQRQFPILLNDVWEHAYYLHYETQRGDYLKAWWAIADWGEAERRYALACRLAEEESAEEVWEAEGGQFLKVDGKTDIQAATE